MAVSLCPPSTPLFLLKVLIRRVKYEDACVGISVVAHLRTAHEFL